MFRISPSLLGNYFFLDCERMLRYTVTSQDQKQEENIPTELSMKTLVTEAIIERGRKWEETVVQEKLQGTVLTGPQRENARFGERILGYTEVLEALRTLKPGSYLYQPHLDPPTDFYRRYHIDPQTIIFSPCRPDLICMGSATNGHGQSTQERVPLRILDIKASDKTKFSHCIQTVLYALMLRDILHNENIARCTLDMERCDIWLFNAPQPEPFEIKRVIAPLENFLQDKLPKILLQPAAQARWNLASRCEWCGYLEHCRKEAEEKQDLSLLPYFPAEAKFFLNTLPEPVKTLPELAKFLERKEAATICRTCGALVGKTERLKAEVPAILSREKNLKGNWQGGKPLPYGGVSIALPKGQNVGIVISLHQDQVTGGIFAAGIHIQGGKDIHGQELPWTCVASLQTQEAYDQVMRQFLARLEEIMQAVHAYNKRMDNWQEKKSLQCYVYDSAEREWLDELLADALKNPELAQQALSLFFYFESERSVDAWHAPNEVPFPVIVLTEALREVIALPVPVSYKLTTVSVTLKPVKYASFYSPKGEFTFPFSNRLRIDSLLEAWASDDQAKIDAAVADLRYELEKRMKATFSILAGVREALGDNLFAYPPKFALPEKNEFRSPVLANLSFMTRYEEVLQYLEIHTARSASRLKRLESGNALAIELIKEVRPSHWEAVLTSDSEHVIPEASGYSDWILCSDDEAGYREQMSFCDFWYREQRWVPKKHRLGFAAIEAVTARNGKRYLVVEITKGSGSPPLEEGKRYLLCERYSDFTSRKILNCLYRLDQQPDNFFLTLLANPTQALAKRSRPKNVRSQAALTKFLAPFGFTPSQQAAFIRVVDANWQLIWGPPGTGKTHFLGLLVHALAAVYEKEGKNLKVLVTAFTHAAIENCLRMIARLADKTAIALQVNKLGEWKGQSKPDPIATCDSWAADEEHHEVVGSTIFTIANENCLEPSYRFDLVIIDEGSQLKVSEAAIPIARVNPKSGRLVIAGDDKQLGPIIKGCYHEPAAGQTSLFGSIFEALRKPDGDQNVYTAELMECFRMNQTLCRFPALTLYGPHYQPATPEIAQKMLQLAPPVLRNSPPRPIASLICAVSPDPIATAPATVNSTDARPMVAGSLAAAIPDSATPSPAETTARPVKKVRLLDAPVIKKVRVMESAETYRPTTLPATNQAAISQPAAVLPAIGAGSGVLSVADWLEWSLNPDYPVVLLILEGVAALAENPVEAGLVAEMAVALRERLVSGTGPFTSDQEFWQQGLFVISPHHVQIHSIYQELYQRRAWDYPPFVETVNKMQGQESECVIISYGVSDMDYALQEGEFIYSLNRLNVSLTRARAKAIVCLPAPLLQPPLSAFGREELIAGLDFMLQLKQLLEASGERAMFSLPGRTDGARLLALRMK